MPGRSSRLISNTFGFSALKNCFTARYHANGEELIAFLSKKKDPAEAERVLALYQAFLMENGGTSVPLGTDLTSASLIEILDTFELIFRHGQYVAGIHEAETQEAAEELAWRLKRRLAEAVQ